MGMDNVVEFKPLKDRFVGPAAPVAFSAEETDLLHQFTEDGQRYFLAVLPEKPEKVILYKLLSGQEIHISKFYSHDVQFQMQVKDLEKRPVSEHTTNNLPALLNSIPDQIFAPIASFREARRREIDLHNGHSNVIQIF